MIRTSARGQQVSQIEILIVGLTTVLLLPVSCLYAMDLAAGIISPDLQRAIAAVVGLLGLWMAVLKDDSFYRARQAARWIIVVTLAASGVALGNLLWGSSQSSEHALSWLILFAPVIGAIHQLVRLIRLRREPPTAL